VKIALSEEEAKAETKDDSAFVDIDAQCEQILKYVRLIA
jgi:hypothetical protein